MPTSKKTVNKSAAANAATGGDKAAPFRLTYATMFDPPEELHRNFERALARVKAELGGDHGMLIANQERLADAKFAKVSPINTDWLLGTFQQGSVRDVEDAVAAAAAAWPSWAAVKWQQRVRLLRKVAALIEKRVYDIAATVALEVGKNRLEALGDVQETADLIYYACADMERNDGFVRAMGADPLVGYRSQNVSVLRPYGVWAVISPFNFPCALAGGPSGAALVAGNTVVFKPASDTPWAGRLLAECMRDAGIPDGVFNLVTGAGGTVGQALVDDPRVAGITFTGSHAVGMGLYRRFANGAWPRPCIAEMGGKNPAIVSRNADLERAALGIFRSAFGLQGQKCSACSRIYVEAPAQAKLTELLLARIEGLVVGDPTRREVYNGPVINAHAYRQFAKFTTELRRGGTVLSGGKQLRDGDLAQGYFCAPTLVAGLPPTHRLWRQEMFLPIALIHGVESLAEAMALACDTDYGLTAGFYGSKKEADWFFAHSGASVNYANRPQGATTGAWPGFQPFGGWKASGSTGKNAGGHYYLPLYMREQVHNRVD